jgi:hypothetical protein
VIYSVYSYDRREYDYYDAPGPGGTHASAPPKAPARHATGATPEGATWHLPFGAKKVGKGALPKGRIATTGVHLGGLGDLGIDMPRAVVIAGIAVLAWRYLR